MDLYRINVSNTHGREEGRVTTVNGHDVFYVERKPNVFGDVTEAQIQEALANGGIRCVLLPIVGPYLTQNGLNAMYGQEKLNHPDVINDGLYCTMVSESVFGINMPFANMDGLYDLCGKLVGVPIRTDIYNLISTMDEAPTVPNPVIYPEEIVIILLPLTGYMASLNTASLWKERYFYGHPDVVGGIVCDVDQFMPKNRARELYAMIYNTYGFLDVTSDVVEVASDNSKATIPVEMQGELEAKSLPDMLAWINAVSLFKADLLGDGELSDMTKLWLNYRAEDVVFPEPTEEEMFPPKPEEPNVDDGIKGETENVNDASVGN